MTSECTYLRRINRCTPSGWRRILKIVLEWRFNICLLKLINPREFRKTNGIRIEKKSPLFTSKSKVRMFFLYESIERGYKINKRLNFGWKCLCRSVIMWSTLFIFFLFFPRIQKHTQNSGNQTRLNKSYIERNKCLIVEKKKQNHSKFPLYSYVHVSSAILSRKQK